MMDTHNEIRERLTDYSLTNYIEDVENSGLEKTWGYICPFRMSHPDTGSDFLSIKNFGELYEIGLATRDKNSKKKNGQYFTPDDIAAVMAKWLNEAEGENVCDVACGTGKLILTYLDLIGIEKARKLISEGRLYLYDSDKTALDICKTSVSVKYGLDISDDIHAIHGDFLDRKLTLPQNAKVISNPPYARLNDLGENRESTRVLSDTREFYAVFSEKIFRQAKSAVVITPFSFISGSKFYSLRRMMCETGSGFIVSFDNVPGNIFCGRKHGIFNTNTANSVRAAVTVFTSGEKKGFRLTPLIRFKNEQRRELLQCEVLENLLGDEYQIVNDDDRCFKKISKNLDGLYRKWSKITETVKDCLSSSANEFLINIPNTCRYYTTACSRVLKRKGSVTLYAKDERTFHFLYCFINSSFAYWWWRIYDGGITYSMNLLKSMPVPFEILTEEDHSFFEDMCAEMIKAEKRYVVTKANAGTVQENIKFPDTFRKKINERIMRVLGCDPDPSIFDEVHSNASMNI